MAKMHVDQIYWGQTLHPANLIGGKMTDICLDTYDNEPEKSAKDDIY